tara:strand:- start:5643 stop:5879 length:237 start_codon:yes stop_codon:yes gene_type:complete
MNNNGLSVKKACEILNCCRSYLYKLVKNGELETLGSSPVTIAPSSIVGKILSDYPYIRTAHLSSKLDYEIKQEVFKYG